MKEKRGLFQDRGNKRLEMWKKRLSRDEAQYEAELSRMDERERLYRGDREYPMMSRDDKSGRTPHVRNIVAEIIEAEVDSSIPAVKVTAMRKEDEKLAKIIEDMIRGEVDRMNLEILNDQMERTVPIQGGGAYLLEWDKTYRLHNLVGDLAVSALHPKQIIPQDGVYTDIEDMDWIFLKIPQTKAYLRQRYGVELKDESETDPDVRGVDPDSPAQDMVTQIVALFRNENGGIGRYSWVGDTELEDLDDYQAPNLSRCTSCGEPEPDDETAPPTLDGTPPPEDAPKPPAEKQKKICPVCGGRKFRKSADDYQELWLPVRRTDGSVIGGTVLQEEGTGEFGEDGAEITMIREAATLVPVYKPDIYPVFLQKNVSLFGRFLGESDVDKIADQQRSTNRLSRKILDKLVNAGSYLHLPPDASIKVDSEEMKVIRTGSAASAAQIKVFTVEGSIGQDVSYLAQVYEEARQAIGVTDSMQGRKDYTATSAKAKEFSAAQAAGRMESKRTMKKATWARLYEAMFKFKLAYADEPRPVIYRDERGEQSYEKFNRWDFLEQDPVTGEYVWNDRFLFSCDTAAPLAANQEAMWQETRMNLQSGAFGDPTAIETLILFWNKMDMLHYPGAGETLRFLRDQLRQKQQAQQAAMAAQKAAMTGGAPEGALSAGASPRPTL